jgi:uncharacterized protein YciI
MNDSSKMQTRSRKLSLLAVFTVVLSATAPVTAQEKTGSQVSPGKSQPRFVVLLKHGPNWIPGKSVSEQPLLKHGRYLQELMDKGTLQLAGPFLDDSGGFILLNAANESEARRIVAHDPGVTEGILEADIRAVAIAFDAATGKSPFK